MMVFSKMELHLQALFNVIQIQIQLLMIQLPIHALARQTIRPLP
jgi:hypothetical protein